MTLNRGELSFKIIAGMIFLLNDAFYTPFISQKMMHNSQVAVLELRRLFYELKDQRPDICVRLRLLGEMWQSSFSRVIKLTENGVVLLNEHNNQAIAVKDLREVVQFEIDAAYQNFQPHNHYNIEATMNVTERHASFSRSG